MPSLIVTNACEFRRFARKCRKIFEGVLMECREKQAEVEDFPYGLSVESFFPRRRANRTMPGERSFGLNRTLRR